MKSPESVCLGGAMLAGVALGEYGNLHEAVKLLVREVSTVCPDPVIAASYAQQARQYRRLYSALTAVTGAGDEGGQQEGQ